jgi:hypothetical protein
MSTGSWGHKQEWGRGKRLFGHLIMDEDRALVWDTYSGRKVLMNADCLEYDVRECRDTRAWPAADEIRGHHDGGGMRQS